MNSLEKYNQNKPIVKEQFDDYLYSLDCWVKDGRVDISSGVRTVWLEFESWMGRDFHFSITTGQALWPTQPLTHWIPQAISPLLKRPFAFMLA
jgi:hypothetical protein